MIEPGTRGVHSISFKLTDFVWELSTVLHVELDLGEDITTTKIGENISIDVEKKRTKCN